MDAPFREGDDNRLLEVLDDDQSPLPDAIMNDHSLTIDLDRALRLLRPRERELVRLYLA